MSFSLPEFNSLDFSKDMFINAPNIRTETVVKDGVAPDYYHSTSMYPECYKINGKWVLGVESRVDSGVVVVDVNHVKIVENRNLKADHD